MRICIMHITCAHVHVCIIKPHECNHFNLNIREGLWMVDNHSKHALSHPKPVIPSMIRNGPVVLRYSQNKPVEIDYYYENRFQLLIRYNVP